MKNSKDAAMNADIENGFEEYIASMSKKYPGHDVELIVAQNYQNFMKKRGESIRQSEIDHFKKLAISSLGTDNEIKFDDAELGFLKAALADGRAGLKEFIESIPVDNPICDDGTKMENRGIEKKTY